MPQQEILRKLLVDLFLANPRKTQQTKQRSTEETNKQPFNDHPTEQKSNTGEEKHDQHSQV